MSLADITKRLRAAENACSRPVPDQGHRLFGENRVQEAAGKWPSWREKYPGVALLHGSDNSRKPPLPVIQAMRFV